MTLFLISYDVSKDHNCAGLFDQLEKWGAVKLLDNMWLTGLQSSTREIRQVLQIHLGIEGRVVVIELSPALRWSTGAGLPPGVAWLKQNLPGRLPAPPSNCRQGNDAIRFLAARGTAPTGANRGKVLPGPASWSSKLPSGGGRNFGSG